MCRPQAAAPMAQSSIATGVNYLVPASSFRGKSAAQDRASMRSTTWTSSTSLPCRTLPRLRCRPSACVYAEAITYAESRRSMIIVDIPDTVVTIDQMQTWLASNDSLAASELRGLLSAHRHARSAQPEPRRVHSPRAVRSPGSGRAPTRRAACGRRPPAPRRGCAMSRASPT